MEIIGVICYPSFGNYTADDCFELYLGEDNEEIELEILEMAVENNDMELFELLGYNCQPIAQEKNY